MWWTEWLFRIYEGEWFALGATVAAAGLLLLFAILSWTANDSGVYVALTAVLGGVAGVAFLALGIGRAVGVTSLSLLSTWGGSLFLLLRGALTVKKRRIERKHLREEAGRRVQYTLPERENEFIRTRLNTVLNVSKNELNADMGGENMENPITLRHAWELLTKVKAASLTAAERLQTEEIERGFSLYIRKESWSTGDVRAVNDLFSMLLKLSAKYAV